MRSNGRSGRRALVTGFEPFRHWSVNSSALAAQVLDGQCLEGVEVVGRILPVAFSQIREAVRLAIEDVEPEVVLLSGLAGGTRALRVEYVGLNLAHVPHSPDNEGQAPRMQPLVPDGPAALLSTAPVLAMVEAVRAAGGEALLSLSAGAYLCNAALYHALHLEAAREQPRPVAFLHVPALRQTPAVRPEATLSMEELIRGYEAVLQTMLAANAASPPPVRLASLPGRG